MVELDRRRFLGLGAFTAAVIATGLAGCGTAAPAQTTGRLRAAFTGGGAGETLNYLVGPTALDFVRARLVHAALGTIDVDQPDGVRYGALESIEISDDLMTYTLRVRPNIAFTDGSMLSAEDILYSLRAPALLQGLPFTQIVGRDFDLDNAVVEDDRTLTLPTLHPIADGRLLLCQSMLAIKAGTTEFTTDTPSCGPFVITQFEAGRETLLTRNPDYFGAAIGDEPTLDEIQLLSIADDNARVAALTGGQADFVSGISTGVAQNLDGTDGIVVTTAELPYASYLRFVMNPSFEPFADVRVRQAFKLAINRQSIIDNVYYGRAYLGNDVPALGFPTYHSELEQRAYDPDTARDLLEQAGQSGMSVELTVGPEMPGMVETGTLIVENLKAIGVDATLRELPAGQLFADYEAYSALPFAVGYNPPALFEPNHTPGVLPDVDALVITARGGATAEQRLAASHEAQQLLWENGNQIGPVFVPGIDAAIDTVSGVRAQQFPDLTIARLSP
ncbi:ABC transporter substrate-binding protein [Actinoalloteichus hymeniacidonis]|uniref:ABC-type dipeptide transport system, periplasmic component n=1 Tax=Actinoalloteichus hymeniacidonis TaxID=340345 RepID=A0AAC9MZ93_9PSEU|nr:ABC transporter substrate-binding protein [Actinoalloteichus hymeniacidonis]AOS63706.1 ABC-type dipeptide transport system, periplasmic component [Actinoalloteichus hymeniacidonis]MBB5908241.1 peptide/nickel transport system substrate-binding protein [Actinoalloteichus hymeniacidonis]